jgi:hypothetical protein
VVGPADFQGRRIQSHRERRRRENDECIGGLRNPAESLDHIPNSSGTAKIIRDCMRQAIADIHSAWEPSDPMGLSDPFDLPTIERVRKDILHKLGWRKQLVSKSQIQVNILAAQIQHSGDADTDLPLWFTEGCPMGITRPLTPRGIFPTSADMSSEDLPQLQRYEEGWSNYRSAEDSSDVVRELLTNMEANGWMRQHQSIDDFRLASGQLEPVMNKLGLVSKERSDHSVKHRLIWDLRRSAVNLHCTVQERTVLPRVIDLVNDVVDLLLECKSGETVVMMILDVANAFHLIPVHPDEAKFLTTSFDGKVQEYSCMVFGPKPAPTVWGRFGAWIARSTQAIVGTDLGRIQLYVDDPASTFKGTPSQTRESTAATLLWWRILDLPLAWDKAQWGAKAKWIGATFDIRHDHVKVSIDESKALEAEKLAEKILSNQVVTKKTLSSMTGKLNFFAGIIITLYPFIMPLWAVLYSKEHQTIPEHLLHTSRLRKPLQWIRAFLRHGGASLTREYHTCRESLRGQMLNIAMDASPWGFGAVRYDSNWRATEYWYDSIRTEECRHLNAEPGIPDYMTLWEALVLLISLRIWADDAAGMIFAVRSDNAGVGTIIGKLRSPNPSLNLISCEIALDLTKHVYEPIRITHIPGTSNKTPDFLSRIAQPKGKQAQQSWPSELSKAKRIEVPIRDKHFWLVSK